MPLERGSKQRTSRVCTPSFPQLRLQALHSSVTHLERGQEVQGRWTQGALPCSCQLPPHRQVEGGCELQNAWGQDDPPPAWLGGLREATILYRSASSSAKLARCIFNSSILHVPGSAVKATKPQ